MEPTKLRGKGKTANRTVKLVLSDNHQVMISGKGTWGELNHLLESFQSDVITPVFGDASISIHIRWTMLPSSHASAS